MEKVTISRAELEMMAEKILLPKDPDISDMSLMIAEGWRNDANAFNEMFYSDPKFSGYFPYLQW